MSIKKLMLAVKAASVELRISGDDVIADGIDRLADDAKAEFEEFRRSGLLWSWCDAEDAIHELERTEGHLGLDIETALRAEYASPRAPIAINKTGVLSAIQPNNKKTKKSEPKFWADPNLTDVRTLQLYAGGERCFVFWRAALATVLRSPL